jgi:alpha-beta hydrolase superfamily lysophospholipase
MIAMPDETLTLTAPDGTRLYVERHRAIGTAKGALVMLHGFAVHCEPYRHVAASFAAAGVDVTAFDCRGHGRSTGRRGYVRQFSDFQDDLHLVVESVRAAAAGLPIALLGHSQGATIALDYALANRGPIAALMLAAPWLALKLIVPVWKIRMSKIMGHVWPTLTMDNELRAEDTTRDPSVRHRLAGDPLAHHVGTPRWFNEAQKAQAHILGRASTLRVPTLMAVAGDDRIVLTETALAFARAAGPIVEVKTYPHAYHELFLEPDWARIVEDFVSWFVSWVVPRLSAPYT